jgi:hypothetical protein
MAQRTKAGIDSCGCAMSARFMAAGLAFSVAWYAWQFVVGAVSLGGMLARVLIVTFAAAAAGKIIGILRYRHRHRHRRSVRGADRGDDGRRARADVAARSPAP